MLLTIALASRYVFASIATATYYEIESFLSIPGAILFYGCISLVGYLSICI